MFFYSKLHVLTEKSVADNLNYSRKLCGRAALETVETDTLFLPRKFSQIWVALAILTTHWLRQWLNHQLSADFKWSIAV